MVAAATMTTTTDRWLPCTRRSIVGTGAMALTMALASPLRGHSLEDLEQMLTAKELYLQVVNEAAPEFELQDVTGRTVRLADFRGKVAVLYFIYAGCPDVCPLQSEKLADIQKAINATPMRDRVQFIAVTTDPERDTADVLRAYGPAHGLDGVNWVFLTSGPNRPAATRELALRYGLRFTVTEDGNQMHATVTHIIDKSGNLRARYHGLKFNPTTFIVHLNALTNDYH
jgi:protein SCO1/2